MAFWNLFGSVYSEIWNILDIKMRFGTFRISFADVLIASAICGVIGRFVWGIVHDI